MPPKKPAAAKAPAKAPAKGGAKGGTKPKGAAKPAAKGGAAAAAAPPPPPAEPEGFEITIKQLDQAIGKEMNEKLVASGKWPILCDDTRLSSTFLRHRDTNMLDAVDPSHMEPNRIRQAVIGAIRFGKPLAIDMMQSDMFDTVTEKFNAVRPWLMDAILDKSILKDEKFMELVEDSDDDLYRNNFVWTVVDDFRFVVLVESSAPASTVGNKLYPVVVKQK